MKRDYYHEQFQQFNKNIKKTANNAQYIKKVNDKSNISETFKIENIETTNQNEQLIRNRTTQFQQGAEAVIWGP